MQQVELQPQPPAFLKLSHLRRYGYQWRERLVESREERRVIVEEAMKGDNQTALRQCMAVLPTDTDDEDDDAMKSSDHACQIVRAPQMGQWVLEMVLRDLHHELVSAHVRILDLELSNLRSHIHSSVHDVVLPECVDIIGQYALSLELCQATFLRGNPGDVIHFD